MVTAQRNAAQGGVLVGAASRCTAACVPTVITTFRDADACCPLGANANSDSDCMPVCGNGVREGDEVCDGDCPTSCSGGTGCNREVLRGTAGTCTATCEPIVVRTLQDGDQCCPDGANANSDSDCQPRCGNGVREGSEICDGDCPSSCSVSAGCNREMLVGSAGQCSAECVAISITAPVAGDKCCPAGVDINLDADCRQARYNICEQESSQCPSDERCSLGVCWPPCHLGDRTDALGRPGYCQAYTYPTFAPTCISDSDCPGALKRCELRDGTTTKFCHP